ncbi:MAG: hypothetical protein C5B52_08535 [Bacteroidetes bacterium]|nr:MAG: hypothetical protein C5B52_08535 [Bacteroidota bacterium]
MNYTIAELFNFSILVPAVTAWIRFKKVNPIFLPVVYFIWIGTLNEIISLIINLAGYSNAINSNIYVLIEACILTLQFAKWDLFRKKESLYKIVLISLLVFWLLENFVVGSIRQFSSYFRIYYSFLVALMSVTEINRLIVTDRKNLFKNPIFLFCIGFIIYFTYKVLVETFWVYGLNYKRTFRNSVYDILLWINLFANLTYATGFLWMNRKLRFTPPF